MSQFPQIRMRRMRRTETLRAMVSETQLQVSNLMYPLFVCEGTGVKEEILSMPGNYRFSVDTLVAECAEVVQLGIPSVLLFGIPAYKDADGSASWQADGIVQKATRALKQAYPTLVVVADVCLCEYTSHGHCGHIECGSVENDTTLELLARQSVSLAEAGVDIIAPSDMMDGRVAAIRAALDAARFEQIPILAYSAKYASAFYGPFRDAAGSAPQFGDRRSYQMNPANTREALREIQLDIAEGADMIMVKPALSYLDIIAKARQQFDVPIAAYNVSGEYAMIVAAAQNGWIDGERAMMEMLLSIKRAGADCIITYFAKQAARILRQS